MKKFLYLLLVFIVFFSGFFTYHMTKNYLKSVQFFLKSAHVNKDQASNDVSVDSLSASYVSSTNYPLSVEAYDLTASNYVEGSGHIGIVCSKLTILDRTGNLFTFADGKINQFYEIDNNFKQFALKYRSDDPLMLRAHSFTSMDNRFFVSYTRYNKDKTFSFVISEYEVECDSTIKVGDYRDIVVIELAESEALNSQGAGGALTTHGTDLLFSFGISSVNKGRLVNYENGSFPRGVTYVQSLDMKTLRRFTAGHRNITALMTVNGGVYSVEHGEKGGDEINLLKDGFHYGYPFYSFGTKYGSYEELVPLEQKHLAPKSSKIAFPTFAYLPSIAPSDAIYLNKSDDFEKWEDSILITGLKSQSLFILKLIEGRSIYSEQIFIGKRLRSITQFENVIWLLTDDGQLLKISKNTQEVNEANIKTSLKALHPSLKKCVQCHNLDPTETDYAPHLANVIGRPIASLGFNYSSGLLEHRNKNWDENTFIKYIQNPYSLSENSKMPNIGISYLDAVTIFRTLQD